MVRRYFRARHVATMVSPLIEDGCVVVDGDRIVDVGPMRELKPPRIDEEIDGILMPGLINAHTHLELTNVTRPAVPGSFTDWILETARAIRGDADSFAARRAEAVRQGIAQCARFGVTCVGDIAQNTDIVRPLLRQGPIRSVSFGECLGIGDRRPRFGSLLARAIDPVDVSSLMQTGVTPHAPYTVDAAGFSEVFALSEMRHLPVATHLAETPDEARFLRDHTGLFGDLYRAIGTNPGPPPGFEGSSVEWIASLKPANLPLLCAHVNYVNEGDLALLVKRKMNVVWCPRTHGYFGHPPHPWRQMRERGVIVCIGTDSCASSPDLNIVDDLRLLHAQYPDETPESLWPLVTRDAACALRWSDQERLIGALQKNVIADLCAFPTRSDEPLLEILETSAMLPTGVWVGGKRLN